MKFVDIYKKNKEIFNYLFIGGITTLITLIVYYFLTICFFGVENGFLLQCANVISWLVAVLFAYFANRRFVFNSNNENKRNEFTKFIFCRILTLMVDVIIMFVFVTVLKYNDQIIKIISQGIVIILNYILSKFFCFKDTKKMNLINYSDKIFGFVFMGILLLGFTTIFKNPNELSHMENRALNKFKVVTIKSFLDNSFQNNIEDSLADQIYFSRKIKVFANKYISFVSYMDINKNICSSRIVNVADGYVTYDCNKQLFREPSNELNYEKLEDNVEVFNKINDYVDSYYFVLDRAYVWDFPNNELLFDAKKYLSDNMKGDYNISKYQINNYDDYKANFYITDHHWNKDGSYKGYKEIMQLLENRKIDYLKPVETIEINDGLFYGSTSKNANLLHSGESFSYYLFDIPEHVVYINRKEANYGEYKYSRNIAYDDFYIAVYGNNEAEVIYDFNNDKENLLVIGSSYTNPIKQLVASHYNKTYFVDTRYYKSVFNNDFDVKEYIDKNDIDKVLILASTDVLTGNQFTLKWGD